MNQRIAYLHNHTNFSQFRLLDCYIKVKDLIKRAVSLGAYGCAITDHESVSGHVDALQCVKKGKKDGSIPEDFKLILGNEVYLVDDVYSYVDDEGNQRYNSTSPYYHFILLAKDEIGHRQLRELSSIAWDHSYYTGKMERVPLPKRELQRVVEENKGHLIASTACIGGELGKTVLEIEKGITELPFGDEEYFESERKRLTQKLEDFILFCKDLFGEDFYFEMQPSDNEEQKIVNAHIVSLSEKYGVKYIVTTDTHYLKKEEREIHAAYLNSREEEREVGDFYATTYMMTVDEIHSYMDSCLGSDVVDLAIANTKEITDKIVWFDLECPTIVPSADIPEFEVEGLFAKWYDRCEYIGKYHYSDNKYDRYLLKLIEDGFYDKIPHSSISPEKFFEMLDRIEIELKEMWLVTEKLGTSISSYYLTTLELIDIMWNEGDSLVGIARGSVTGMFTMYLIGLIQMNPMDWGLPHWRHISHEKVELSDVDIDSQANRRGQIIDAVKRRKGERKVLNCCTFKTEGSKSAILTAGRGLGLDNDVTSYIANMIPIVRGFSWSLSDCAFGNEEENKQPIKEFVDECAKYPKLLETALAIEGCVCGRSIHASAVYLFNDDFLEHNARMKAPNGVYITQFNMKSSDYCSGLKMDFLTVEALDKIRTCMDLLIEAGYMEWQGSLRATYDKYLHPDVLDYDTEEMWDMVADNTITDLFQFDTQVGLVSAKRIKPHSLIEMATANSIMRLMVEDGEQPIDTYIRYKNDINEWYKCMREEYKLTEDEIVILERYLLPVYGVGDTQEIVMELSMDEHISGFNVTYANKLRKGIAKKDKELQAAMKKMFFEHGTEIGTSENMLNYIWKEVVGKQLGYSFSKNHTFPYSGIGLQELNLAYHYPIIFWNCACLIVNAGADEESESNKSTQYGKIASAISKMQKRGVEVALPLINEAEFAFRPDENNNRIIFSLKGLNGIGDDVAHLLVKNRPYTSMEDFYTRMIDTGLIKNAQMVKLIKAGCFTELHNKDRRVTMREYLSRYKFKPSEKLTMQQFNSLNSLGLIPQELELMVKVQNFKKYVLDEEGFYCNFIDPDSKRALPKCGYNDRHFILDDNSMPFFKEHFTEDSVVGIKGEHYIVSEKKFKKECDKLLQPLKDWFESEDTLKAYNNAQLDLIMKQFASGTVSAWEMDSLSYYYSDHELANINTSKYYISEYDKLPEEPEAYDYYYRWVNSEKKAFPKYKITRLAGTVLDSNKDKHYITLLCHDGTVATCKFDKGTFMHYNKTISRVGENGKKETIDKPWFSRSSKILICGYRNGDVFKATKYSDSIFQHRVSRIDSIDENGDLVMTLERPRIDEYEE